MAELVRYTLDENVAKLDEVPTDDIAFVITHTKSYGIQRLVNVLARRLGEQAELAEKLNASDEATWDPLDKTRLAMHNAVAKTASDKLREAANQRLAIIERRTRLHQ
ncbi:hypothetical protein OF122_09545 [Pelagibacterium flavum]|uniref:Uncharacterized protein n=1 Tax=Pelagibacterium flavum TaxID=2984530 RepID=A0ABY6IXS2_9HYPH|nr:hypothetical protein [Pelagibacterium sp. YIM 151497]UYQ73980.1 hypothetical protein OF122_09545 [Pelagibacterium sp. YIM 151497]